MVMAKIRGNRLVLATGGLFLLLALGHIPTTVLKAVFDKNAFVHFIILMLVAVLFGLHILRHLNKFIVSGRAIASLWILVIVVMVSALASPSLINSMVGDTGRHVGVISLFCLLLASIYHAQFSLGQMRKLLWLYLFAVSIVALLGLFQYIHWLSFPGDGGPITSTLGNLDFYGAFLGTSLPLFFYLWLDAHRRARIIIALAAILNITGIYLSGRRQAFVDIALLVIGIVIYLLRRFIPRRELTLDVRNAFLTLGFVIWIEGIFLMPFLGKSIPVLGSDIQVKIRGQFWDAALKQLVSHPLLGVGPDQYGNYYEQYRNVESLKQNATLLANDAHGANVQTLATLGIFGALAFALLIALLIRSLLILWDRRDWSHKVIFVFGLYFFVFLTNSAISPITLPNKFLFWAVAGFVVGQAYKDKFHDVPEGEWDSNIPLRRNRGALMILVIFMIGCIAFIGINFSWKSTTFISALETHARHPQQKVSLDPSPYLPCLGYFDAVAQIAQNQGNNHLYTVAYKEVQNHPRCFTARMIVAQVDWINGDMTDMGKQVHALIEIAPSRMEFLKMATAYAARVKDTALQHQIYLQMVKIGFIEIIHTGEK